ncbi:hypothetical protein NLX86_14625 [Streptomyces sp. A3M-1-3]|uniref:hypothetical protein n=1 Tax=Streptomyces sp. A3M-1-3 TaxID=2962044 RepID=UPI0020B7D665|nr:hypothetical protein [Streptomyces sp. A3M-1-3]MCP3819292.1 hypothetical protein [Streptomyces sp. A3M-1-3]
MTTPTDRTTNTDRTEPAASVGELALDLSDDLTAGRWTPSHLDRRLARFLVLTSAGDGQLTADRLRTALWEGGEPLLRQPDSRFASLLAQLIPGTASVLDDATVHALLRRLTPRR